MLSAAFFPFLSFFHFFRTVCYSFAIFTFVYLAERYCTHVFEEYHSILSSFFFIPSTFKDGYTFLLIVRWQTENIFSCTLSALYYSYNHNYINPFLCLAQKPFLFFFFSSHVIINFGNEPKLSTSFTFKSDSREKRFSFSLPLSLFLSLWVPKFRSIHKFRRDMFGWLLCMRMSWPRRYADYSGHRWATNENSYNKSLDWVIFVLIFSYSWQLYGSYVSLLHFSYFHLQHLNICCFLFFSQSLSRAFLCLSMRVWGNIFFLYLCMGFFLIVVVVAGLPSLYSSLIFLLLWILLSGTQQRCFISYFRFQHQFFSSLVVHCGCNHGLFANECPSSIQTRITKYICIYTYPKKYNVIE